MNWSAIILLILPVVAAVGGLTLLLLGWRGRRLDMHPVCRRCGFDLFGLPAGVRICSECGADLNRRRATRCGNRQKRPWFIFFGATPLMLSLTFLGGVGWVAWRGTDVNKYKPLWWLALEIDYRNADARSAAYTEMYDRITRGKLTTEQINALADRCLARQADLRRPWVSEWGCVVELSRRCGLLDDSRWNRYIEQAIKSAMKLRARQQVRRGDPLPLLLISGSARTGWSMSVGCERTFSLHGTSLGSAQLKEKLFALTGRWVLGEFEKQSIPPSAVELFPDGTHRASVIVRPVVVDGAPISSTNPIRLEVPWALVPADTQTVELIDDESRRESILAIFQRVIVSQRLRYLYIEIDFGRSPIPLAYQIKIRAPDRQFTGSDLIVHAGSSGWFYEHIDVGPEPLDRVDLILEPSIDAAVRTVDITRIWNGRIEMKDLPVK